MASQKPFITESIYAGAHADSTPILLIHGFNSSGAQDWDEQQWINPLKAAGRKVIVVDLPAHGDSARVDAPEMASVTKIVAALAKIIDAHGGKADVVGYSLGARLAWALASQRPERVSKLVLGGLSAGDPFAMLDYDAARKFAEDGTKPEDEMTAMIASMALGDDKDSHSLINLMQGLGSEPFDPSAERPSAPTLLAAGTEDPMAGNVEAIEPHLKSNNTVRVPGDHFSALKSESFRNETFAFLGVAQ
jgi:pimeloyl-ACP methyl ester carboxylesterase